MSISDTAQRHEASVLWTLEEIGRLVSESGETSVPLQAKSAVAGAILDAVEPLVGALAPAVTP